jgi:hypothetical protein
MIRTNTYHTRRVTPHVVSIVLSTVMIVSWPVQVRAEYVTRTFRESDALPANPGQGWMSQQIRPYALSKGTGLRRDGVGSPWHERNWIGTGKYQGLIAMAESWKQAPVVFEWYGNYNYFRHRQ